MRAITGHAMQRIRERVRDTSPDAAKAAILSAHPHLIAVTIEGDEVHQVMTETGEIIFPIIAPDGAVKTVFDAGKLIASAAGDIELIPDMVMPDGIYLGMPDHQYHAIERLSASGMQKMLTSPATFWASSWLNPDREPRKGAAHFVFGSAYHCATLEPEKFLQKYGRSLTKDDMPSGPKCLTNDDMQAALKDLGLPQTQKGETVMDRAERLYEAGYSYPIFHLEERRWREAAGDKIMLSPDMWQAVTRDREMIEENPEISALFTGGLSEVTVLWTCAETGVPMKARIDYLRPDLIVDLKTFANMQGKELRQKLIGAVQYDKYYIQIANYWQASEVIRQTGLPLIGGADDREMGVIEALRRSEIPLGVTYVFQEKDGIPNIVAASVRIFAARVYDSGKGVYYGDMLISKDEVPQFEHSRLYNRSANDIFTAKRTFRKYSEFYERGARWYPITQFIEITDADFSDRFLNPEEF